MISTDQINSFSKALLTKIEKSSIIHPQKDLLNEDDLNDAVFKYLKSQILKKEFNPFLISFVSSNTQIYHRIIIFIGSNQINKLINDFLELLILPKNGSIKLDIIADCSSSFIEINGNSLLSASSELIELKICSNLSVTFDSNFKIKNFPKLKHCCLIKEDILETNYAESSFKTNLRKFETSFDFNYNDYYNSYKSDSSIQRNILVIQEIQSFHLIPKQPTKYQFVFWRLVCLGYLVYYYYFYETLWMLVFIIIYFRLINK